MQTIFFLGGGGTLYAHTNISQPPPHHLKKHTQNQTLFSVPPSNIHHAEHELIKKKKQFSKHQAIL